MTQGEVITTVFVGVVSFVSGTGVILSFIKKWFTDPQIAQTKVQSITNKQLSKLATQMEHQNEMTAIKLRQHDIDIKKVDDRLTKSYIFLDDKFIKLDDRVDGLESIVFVKERT